MNDYTAIIGKHVRITIDRPLGSAHPKYPQMIYPINYGYIEGIIGGDGEDQDIYLLGVHTPVDTYEAEIIAVIHRLDDVEDKWVAAPSGLSFSKEEIKSLTHFQEKYYQVEIYC